MKGEVSNLGRRNSLEVDILFLCASGLRDTYSVYHIYILG